MKIYTRTGDRGTTALFGGDRVTKDHPRIDAYGTVDEANSAIGLARSLLQGEPGQDALDPVLAQVQADLFVLGADLATLNASKPAVPRIEAAHVEHIEHTIDRFDEALPPLKHFVLPGGTSAAAALHLSRTVCRRAERLAVATAGLEAVNEHAVTYLNRLSDLLFVLARWANQQAGVEEATWSP